MAKYPENYSICDKGLYFTKTILDASTVAATAMGLNKGQKVTKSMSKLGHSHCHIPTK